MNKIAPNIRHLRQLKSWSQQRLGDELKIPRARIGAYEEARCVPPVEVLLNLSTLFHINLDTLVKADLSRTESDSLIKVGENRLLFPVMVDQNNEDLIEVITAKASAGYLSGYADPEYMERLPRMQLPFRVTGKHRSFPIRGDSMPPLQEGCFVVGRYLESLKEIRNGETYIVVTRDDGLVYKRLFLKGNVLELHSDNRNYDPYNVKASEVLEIWEFVCALNISDKKEEELNLESIMRMLQSMRVEIEGLKS